MGKLDTENEMSEPTFRRRRYLIDIPMQLGLSARFLGWVIGYLVLFVGLLLVPVLWDGVFGEGEVRLATALLERLKGFAGFNLVALIAVLSLFTLHMIRFTHRFAGPMLRFRSILRDIGRGMYPEYVRLRRHDFLKDFALELTQALTGLREQTLRCRRINAATQQAARRLLQVATEVDADPETLVMLAHEVLATAERLDRNLPHVGAANPLDQSTAPVAPDDDSVPATDEAIAGPVGG
jgi:hypothetical protein